MMSTPHSNGISITGVGAVSCAGSNLDSFWQSAVSERSGINEAGLGLITEEILNPLRDEVLDSGALTRPVLIAVSAIKKAMYEAGWSALDPETDGIIVASTVSQVPYWEKCLISYLKGQMDDVGFSSVLRLQSLGSLNEAIAEYFRFQGKNILVASACSAATQAIGLASLWIKQGRVKRCLVGGAEVMSGLTFEGFKSLQLFNPKPARPFDLNRQGINLSEGAAFFCLEKAPSAAIAEVAGCGFTTDAYHMAAPHPEGRGSYQAMRAAIKMAGVQPSDVDWVHAHGTGSVANDLAEGSAFAQLFGQTGPFVSSTKAIHGHALGASGAIETALCVQALRKQVALRTVGLVNPDPAIKIRHLDSNRSMPLNYILKNTLGFGGNNAALVLKRCT